MRGFVYMGIYGVGLDIGYSQIKMAVGDTDHDEPQTMVRPAMAGPAALLSSRFLHDDAPGGIEVLVQGAPWIACGDSSLLQGATRELHADYTATDNYRALFYAALRLTGRSVIDAVVTGLPVSHYQIPAYRKRLEEFMAQDHLIAPSHRVKVLRTQVLPQPAGAYIDFYTQREDLTDLLNEGRVVVIDIGYFSADWAIFERRQFHNLVSGSSQKAMSRLLDTAHQHIARDHDGGGPGVDALEDALRNGRDTVLVFGERVVIAPYLASAAHEVAPQIATHVRAALRDQSDNIDLVLLVGGGARLYQKAVQEAFPRSRLEVPDDGVIANARGFWFHA